MRHVLANLTERNHARRHEENFMVALVTELQTHSVGAEPCVGPGADTRVCPFESDFETVVPRPQRLATPQTASAHAIGITCTENRPGYVQPRAMNAHAIAAKKNSTAAAGRSRNRGTPRMESTATAAPTRTGDA